jgi:cystathionine gamma-synthase
MTNLTTPLTPNLEPHLEEGGPRTTALVRSGLNDDTQYNAVIAPLHLSATYRFPSFGTKGQYDYARSGNPTRDALIDMLVELESGTHGVATCSGMSAIHLLFQTLQPSDLVLASSDLYGGTHRLLARLAQDSRLRVVYVDSTDVAATAAAITQHQPQLVYIETPSNPLLKITDIAALAEHCTQAKALLAVDNTFLSPSGQQPLTLGADVVLHSTTKYINGHSDVIGGAVICKDEGLGEALTWWANCLGLSASPFDAHMTMRGARTLFARSGIHAQNASTLASWLNGQSVCTKVYYPGLPNHPGHAIARAQQSHFGGVLSVELAATVDIAAVTSRLRCFTLAESLGGVESLVAHPASMTHAAMSAEQRQLAGISERLLRFSVGIEAQECLLADLKQALVG